MDKAFTDRLAGQLEQLREQGLFKSERVLDTPQQAIVGVADHPRREVINLCANNYLGLANHPQIVDAAARGVREHGYGMASVRFICGTQTVHKHLEKELSAFLGTEDTILYSSCFDANGGLFEALLSEKDAVISDNLNHASLIDGIRLCKAARLRYANNDMSALESRLQEAGGARVKLIATDGVFSMDGSIAKLKSICDLADRYGALVMVDDSHGTGILGATGRGSPEYCGVTNRVDVITSTLGKALGGASGGFASGRREIVSWLRQNSRPYLFSNSLAPVVATTSIAVLELLGESDELRRRLLENSAYFRAALSELGFALLPGEHPIIPIMVGDARLANQMADELLGHGVYVIGFSYPVVRAGEARIRVQMSAAHSRADLDHALSAFATVGKGLGLIH